MAMNLEQLKDLVEEAGAATEDSSDEEALNDLGGLDFSQIMQQAVRLKSAQVSKLRKEFEQAPGWVKASLKLRENNDNTNFDSLDFNGKLLLASHLKDAGNQEVSQSKWMDALQCYSRALTVFYYFIKGDAKGDSILLIDETLLYGQNQSTKCEDSDTLVTKKYPSTLIERTQLRSLLCKIWCNGQLCSMKCGDQSMISNSRINDIEYCHTKLKQIVCDEWNYIELAPKSADPTYGSLNTTNDDTKSEEDTDIVRESVTDKQLECFLSMRLCLVKSGLRLAQSHIESDTSLDLDCAKQVLRDLIKTENEIHHTLAQFHSYSSVDQSDDDTNGDGRNDQTRKKLHNLLTKSKKQLSKVKSMIKEQAKKDQKQYSGMFDHASEQGLYNDYIKETERKRIEKEKEDEKNKYSELINPRKSGNSCLDRCMQRVFDFFFGPSKMD